MIHPFPAHVALLHTFLDRRDASVACIERLLNCQKKPVEFQQDFVLLSQQLKSCFADQSNLGDELEQAHWASGFKPRAQVGNDLVDPVEQLVRAFHMWRHTTWPGQKGRVHFAHTLFNLYVVRCLALLCMRLWDEAQGDASARLAQLQGVLDALWRDTPTDQPKLVRDVRWLFPVAMSPTTDSLAGYFGVAERIAATFTEEDRVETQKAWVQTGAGHLRSQLRSLATHRAVPLDDKALVLLTRVSNALDLALLVQGLVTLMTAYERCKASGDETKRRELASAICQGFSPDPDLFVNRLDLLGPYSMIEHLFITADSEGKASYTAMGQRHVALLEEYAALLFRLAQPLYEDWQQSQRAAEPYSPFGALYGFASNLLELTAFKTLQRDAATQFSMEDAFTGGAEDKRAWVNDWRKLPHIKPEVAKQFEYPQRFVGEISARIEGALTERVAGATAVCGRLFLVHEEEAEAPATLAHVPDLALRYILASDPQLIASHKATFKDQDDLWHCRNEGEFLVSYATARGEVAITKDMLTDVLGAGHDAKITVPARAAAVLRLMCPDLLAPQSGIGTGSSFTS